MIEIRIHGRGGQGGVTTAEVIARAAFYDGKQSQAFPFFGVARRGAPVEAYCRIDEQPVRVHQQVYEPDYVIVLDDALTETADVFKGIKSGGSVLIASSKKPEEISAPEGVKIFTVDAYKVAREIIGKPIVSMAVIGAFAKITNLITLESVEKGIRDRFKGEIGDKNVLAAKACADLV